MVEISNDSDTATFILNSQLFEIDSQLERLNHELRALLPTKVRAETAASVHDAKTRINGFNEKAIKTIETFKDVAQKKVLGSSHAMDDAFVYLGTTLKKASDCFDTVLQESSDDDHRTRAAHAAKRRENLRAKRQMLWERRCRIIDEEDELDTEAEELPDISMDMSMDEDEPKPTTFEFPEYVRKLNDATEAAQLGLQEMQRNHSQLQAMVQRSALKPLKVAALVKLQKLKDLKHRLKCRDKLLSTSNQEVADLQDKVSKIEEEMRAVWEQHQKCESEGRELKHLLEHERQETEVNKNRIIQLEDKIRSHDQNVGEGNIPIGHSQVAQSRFQDGICQDTRTSQLEDQVKNQNEKIREDTTRLSKLEETLKASEAKIRDQGFHMAKIKAEKKVMQVKITALVAESKTFTDRSIATDAMITEATQEICRLEKEWDASKKKLAQGRNNSKDVSEGSEAARVCRNQKDISTVTSSQEAVGTIKILPELADFDHVQLREEIRKLRERLIEARTYYRIELSLREPLVQIGRRIRERFMERSKTVWKNGGFINVDPKIRGRACQATIEQGNEAAHGGNIEADLAMFQLQFLKSDDEKELFYQLYYRTVQYLLREKQPQRMKEIQDMEGTMAHCLAFTPYTASRPLESEFGKLRDECEAILQNLKGVHQSDGAIELAFSSDLDVAQKLRRMKAITIDMRRLCRKLN